MFRFFRFCPRFCDEAGRIPCYPVCLFLDRTGTQRVRVQARIGVETYYYLFGLEMEVGDVCVASWRA